MHFTTTHLITLLTAMSGLAAAAPAPNNHLNNMSPTNLDKRIPRLGAFGVSATRTCPLDNTNQEVFEFALGQESNECRTFWSGKVYSAVDVYYWDPKCLLTLFTKSDCSDDGVVTGPNCWTPEGGIAAYKVTCPYRDA